MAIRTVTFLAALALFAAPLEAHEGEAARVRLGGFWAGGGLGGAELIADGQMGRWADGQ
jgi:hypothetical protein